MGAKQVVSLGIGDPFAVRRKLRLADVAAGAGGQDVVLQSVDIHVVQLMVGAGPQKRFGIGRPHDGALVAIGAGDLFDVFAQLVGDVDLFATGAVGNKSDPLAIGRPVRAVLLPRCFGDALERSLIGRDGENIAVHRDGRPFVGRRQAVAFGLIGQRDELGLILFKIALDVDADLARLAARDVELPDAEVVLVHDGFAVGRDAREKEVAVGVVGHLHGLAALIGNSPDVVDALHDFRAARLDGFLIGQLVGDEINLAVQSVHGPEKVAMVVFVAEFGELFGGEILDPQVGRVGAAIMFAGP